MSSATKVVEAYINLVFQISCIQGIILTKVAEETQKDETLRMLIECLRSGHQLVETKLSCYKHVLNEVAVTEDGLILRGNRIVIPESLRERFIEIAHEGHQAIVKTMFGFRILTS
jgi:hypothetical protein